MKISKTLLTTIAASVMLGGVMTSCVSEKIAINPEVEVACEADCEIDHNHKEVRNNTNSHADNCPACGLG